MHLHEEPDVAWDDSTQSSVSGEKKTSRRVGIWAEDNFQMINIKYKYWVKGGDDYFPITACPQSVLFLAHDSDYI